jgi:hypothetical protein
MQLLSETLMHWRVQQTMKVNVQTHSYIGPIPMVPA